MCVIGDSFIIITPVSSIGCVFLLCDMPHSYVWHASLICLTCEQVVSLVMESCCITEYGLFYRALLQKRPIIYVWRASLICRDMPRSDMTCSYVWHGPFVCGIWPIYTCDTTHLYAGIIRVTWLIHTCDMTHLFVWTDMTHSYAGIVRVTWLVRMCAMTHLYLCHGSFMCDMTHSYVCHDSFIRGHRTCDMTRSYAHSYAGIICVTWHIHKCGMTHLFVCHDSFICGHHMCDLTHAYAHSYAGKPPSRLDPCQPLGIYLYHITCLVHACGMTHSYVRHSSIMCAYVIRSNAIYMWVWPPSTCWYICACGQTLISVCHCLSICGHDPYQCAGTNVRVTLLI